MSKNGIEYAVFATKNSDGTYTNGCYISPVAAYTGNPNVASGADHGDNRALDPESYVVGGTLNVEFNRDQDDIYTFLLGHTKDTKSGEIAYNSNDEAPVVGTGAIGRSDGKYKAIFYPEVQFHEPNDENTTRNNSIQHNHVALEGDIMVPKGGNWKFTEKFDTLDDAKAYLNAKVGITNTTPGTNV